MNANFFVNGRWYKTPCKTVLTADTFTVKLFTGKHTIVANVSDKCYFASIDNISLSNVKCDFHFSRKYTKPKEFLSKLYDTLDSFISTTITFLSKLLGVKRPVRKNTDEILDILFEEVIAIDRETAEECKKPETFEPFIASGEKCFYISPEINNKKSAINSLYGLTSNTTPEISNEYDETKELLAVEQFERLTGTLHKSLFKAIGLEETRRIPFIISNNMVYFNYNGMQYKYNPAQCKVYKKDGRKYQRINWKDFTDDNSPTDQKQARERSPPFTPDMRSTTIQ